MTEIISVRFKSGGRQYYFDPSGMTVEAGQGVIVETSRGLEYGECVQGNRTVEDSDVVLPLRPAIRIATEHDLEIVEKNHRREEQAFLICQEKIEEHELEMKLVSVEQNFEGNKLMFFFTADNRVDFRALVKDLAATFHTRIELRQIGVRDEAKLLGGLGICGKPFCCATFLGEFQPVSIKMAKTQNLSLNPTKISGTCGRLMCCLKYEQDAYEDAVKRCPKVESFVETPDGVGTVSGVNLLRETVKVHLENSDDPPKTYLNQEINIVRSGKGKRPENYVAPPKDELEKLRYIPVGEDEKKEKTEQGLADIIHDLMRRNGGNGVQGQQSEKQRSNSHKHRESRKPGSPPKKNGADNQKDGAKPSKGKLKGDGRKPAAEGKQGGGHAEKRPADKHKDDRKQGNGGQPSPAEKSGERKTQRRSYRHSYRGKPRGSGEGQGSPSAGES